MVSASAPSRGRATYYGFTYVTDGLQCRHSQRWAWLVAEPEQYLDHVHPLSYGKFDCGDGSDELGGNLANLRVGRREAMEGLFLDFVAYTGVETQPACRILLLSRKILRWVSWACSPTKTITDGPLLRRRSSTRGRLRS